MSIAYYDRNAAAFFRDTIAVPAPANRARFLSHLRAGAAILDAGCGSGRDALAFLDAGYAVTALDASQALADLASKYLGQTVLHMRFEEVTWNDAFDGIWASASLLHVPEAELPDVLSRLAKALRASGILFASFKYGTGERQRGDRSFTDMDEARIAPIMDHAGLQISDLWVTQDVRPHRSSERWLNVLAHRAAEAPAPQDPATPDAAATR